MNDQQIQRYRDRLIAMGQRIDGEVTGLRGEAMRGTGGGAGGNLSNTPLHLADLSSETYEQEVATGLLQNEQEVLTAVQGALDRIAAGTYGRCGSCGKEIPHKRLDAVPYVRFCVPCEEQYERENGGTPA